MQGARRRGRAASGSASYLRLGKGEETTGGRDKSSILADTLEALLGAVYLDHGLEAAGDLIHRLFDPLIAESAGLGAGLDWKTCLQELTARAARRARLPGRGERPRPPEALHRHGAGRRASWGDGEGNSKKEAEQRAAEAAWGAIRAEVTAPRRGRRHPRRVRRGRGQSVVGHD